MGELCFTSTLLEIFVARLDEGTLEINHKSVHRYMAGKAEKYIFLTVFKNV